MARWRQCTPGEEKLELGRERKTNQRVWNCSSLSISTKVHLCCSKIQKHIPCWSPTWILWRLSTWGVSDRYILDACWLAHISNAEVFQRSGLSTIGDILRHRRLSLSGHVARLDPRVSAHDAMRLMVDTYEGRKPMAAEEDHRVALATSSSTGSINQSINLFAEV